MVDLKPQEVIFVGTREGLRLLIDAQTNIDTLKDAIRRRLAEAPGFFAGATVALDTKGAVVPVAWVEEVKHILESHGLKVDHVDAALEARLRATSHVSAGSAETLASTVQPAQAAQSTQTAQTAPQEEPEPALPGADTLLVRQSLRSGQSASFEGNLVILGDVNPGSEVWANGDIVVFGALRGVAHAGAAGNRDARVVALKLQPTQLRIADKITRAPDDDVKAPRGPEQAFLKDGAIVIEPWKTHAGTVFGG